MEKHKERNAGYLPTGRCIYRTLIEKEGKDKMLNLLKNQTLENAQEIYGAEKLDNSLKEFESTLSSYL